MIQSASTAAGRPVDQPPIVGFSFFGLCKLSNGTDVNAGPVRQGWALATDFVKIYESEQDEPKRSAASGREASRRLDRFQWNPSVVLPAIESRKGPTERTCRVKTVTKLGWVQLSTPARKYEGDLARALIDERNLLLDYDVAEPAQLRCQSFRFSRQRMKFDLARDDAVDRDQKGGACERRGPRRNELANLDLLIHREKFRFRGGARWGLSHGCRGN
jgi:hypothetical protein